MKCHACLQEGYKTLYMVELYAEEVYDHIELFCKKCYMYQIGTDPELEKVSE